MASNTLTGVVQITAPGAAQVFNGVAEGAKKAETALKNVAPATTSAASAITLLANNIKSGSSQFTVLGEAGQLAGSKLRSLSGVLNTTASTIPVLGNAAQSIAPSILQMAEAFGLAHLAGHILGEGFKIIVDTLNEGKRSFSDADIAAGRFADTLQGLKQDVEDLKSSLDFSGKIQKLALELSGLSGTNLKIAGGNVDIANNDKLVSGLDEKIKLLQESNKKIEAAKIELEKTVLKITSTPNSFIQAVQEFGSIAKIPENVAKTLSKDDQAFLEQFRKTNDEIRSLQADRKNALESSVLIAGGGFLDVIKDANKKVKEEQDKKDADDKKAAEDAKRLLEKQKADYERYVNDTISKGKQLAAFFEGRRVVEHFSIFDSKGEQFEKAKKQIKDFTDGVMKIIPDVKIPVQIAPDLRQLADPNGFFGELKDRKINLAVPIQLKLTTPNIDNTALKKAAQELTDTFNQTLHAGIVDSFASLGEGIGNALSGKDFGKGLFAAIGNLIISLGKALIEFGVVKKFVDNLLKSPFFKPGAVVIGAGILAIAAGTLIKSFAARALGGPVSAGGSYLVGEKGPELFRPNTGGQIIPNNQLGTRGVGGSGGLMVQVMGSFELQGQNLVAAITLANQSKLRLQ